MGNRKVPNTATEAGAMDVMAEAMLGGGSSNAIEVQEAQGQKDFVNSTQLPVDGSNDEVFTKMGIVFGIAVEGELFRHADLPEGWRKEETDHAMWSKLIDNNGNERAAIFYKAAFYDRSANIRPSRRFRVQNDYDYGDAHPNEIRACVFDAWGGEDSVRFDAKGTYGSRDERWGKMDALEATCKEWLVEHYPEWGDVSAYWDKE